MKRTHSDLVNACLDVLAARRIFAWKSNTGAVAVGKRFVRFGKKGTSDILGIFPSGRFLAVEVKLGRDQLRPEQSDFAESVEKNNGTFLIIRDTVDDLIRALEMEDD